MGALRPFVVVVSLCFLAVSSTGHNITEILAANPDYSLFNSYLSQTKLADDINSRQTVTVLALPNAVMSALAAKRPLGSIKAELSLHVLLDYFDPQKLHALPKGTTLITTLYQTTGHAAGNLGFVNITDLKGGKVGFASAAPGSTFSSTFTKSVQQIPYNISVIEVSAPIAAPATLAAPAPSAGDVNITAALEKAGCKTFAALLVSSGVIKVYASALEKGLTVFAPTEEALKAPGAPDLAKLTNAELVSVLLFHALPEYKPIGSLKTAKDPINTLASNGAGKYDLTVTTAGDEVTLKMGVDSSRIAQTLIDSTPLCIFTVDSLLLPVELFGKAPSPAPAAEPVTAPAPSPEKVAAPSPGPVSAKAPSPVHASPPAPPTETPGGTPSEAPTTESENSTSGKSTAAADGKYTAMVKALVTVLATVVLSVFLS